MRLWDLEMEKLSPEISRDWEPPGEVWIEISQAPPGQPCSDSAPSKFSMPWVCLVLFFFFFFLGTSPTHQILHDFLPPAPDFPETQPLGSCQTPAAGSWCCQNCPGGCSGVTSSNPGTSLSWWGDKVGMEPGAWAHPGAAGSVSEQVPAVKVRFAGSSSEMKAASGATFPQELPC